MADGPFEGEDSRRDQIGVLGDSLTLFAVATPDEKGSLLVIVDDGYRSLVELYDAWPELRPADPLASGSR